VTGSTPRPAEYHVLGCDGPVVVVPGRVAAWLLSRAGLADYHRAHRGDDAEVDQVLVALKLVALAWRERTTAGAGCGTQAADTPPQAAPSPRWLTTTAAARALGITARAVVKAVAADRLPAQWSAGRWWINPADVEHYRARRTAA
jgi:helix-turn-helix protein